MKYYLYKDSPCNYGFLSLESELMFGGIMFKQNLKLSTCRYFKKLNRDHVVWRRMKIRDEKTN